MEMIPVWVDGTLTPVEKLEAHRRGLRHKAVSVFVMAGDQVLIQQRAASKYHTPGLWANTCCTHPHWGEEALDCAYRRLRQELGMTGLDLQSAGQVSYRAEVGGGLTEDEVVDVFTAATTSDHPLDLNPEEVQAVRWIPLDRLIAEIAEQPEIFTPWLRIYLARHRDQIFSAR